MNQEKKSARFRQIVNELSKRYTPFDMARWFSHGNESITVLRNARTAINRKMTPDGEPGARGATTADVVAWELIAFLDKQGYDLGTIEFDEVGHIVNIRKRPKFSKAAQSSGE